MHLLSIRNGGTVTSIRAGLEIRSRFRLDGFGGDSQYFANHCEPFRVMTIFDLPFTRLHREVRHFATTFDASGEEAGNLLHKRPWPQQLLAENHGIFNGHTGTLSKMWRHRVNGIADQQDATSIPFLAEDRLQWPVHNPIIVRNRLADLCDGTTKVGKPFTHLLS